jgi:Aldehyde dehydrogenase family
MLGNVLLLKHAEIVPQSALAFARLLEEAGAPNGVYTNLFASIQQIERLVEDLRIRGCYPDPAASAQARQWPACWPQPQEIGNGPGGKRPTDRA